MVNTIDRVERKRREFVRTVLIMTGAGFVISVYAGLVMGGMDSSKGILMMFEGVDWERVLAVFLFGMMCVGLLVVQVYDHYLRDRNSMHGEEHGSARWGNENKRSLERYNLDYVYDPKTVKKFNPSAKTTLSQTDANKRILAKIPSEPARNACFMYSQILGKDMYLSMNTKYSRRNLNSFVFGGSGVGKSRNFVKPNLLQANSSYICTDPSGELMADCAGFLKKEGYRIVCFNTEDMSRSCRYNPFAYVHSNTDIPKMVNALTKNIDGPKQGGGDSKFWDQTRMALLTACCGYLFESRPIEQRNFTNVMKMLRMSDTDHLIDIRPLDQRTDERGKEKPPTDADLKTKLDILFDDWAEVYPNSYAVKQYRIFQMAGTKSKTAQNILISTAVTLGTFFDNEDIMNLTYKDELQLEKIGLEKTALFIITPQGDLTYGFLASMLYTQLFDVLYITGEEKMAREGSTDPSLPVPVRVFIDEMANIGQIPDFSEKLATMRKYGISANPIFQNKAQIEAVYKKDAESIIGNCDVMIYLGGMETATVKMLSEKLGKGTISTDSSSMGRGGGTKSYQSAGRELMTASEIEQVNNDKALVFVRGCKPFLVDKYPYEKHPNHKYAGEADPSMAFSNHFYLSYDIETVERVTIKDPTEEGYLVPTQINPQAFAKTMSAEQRQAAVDKLKKAAAEKNREKKELKAKEEEQRKALEDKKEKETGYRGLSDEDKENLRKSIDELDDNSELSVDEIIRRLGGTKDRIKDSIIFMEGYMPTYGFETDYDFDEDSFLTEWDPEGKDLGLKPSVDGNTTDDDEDFGAKNDEGEVEDTKEAEYSEPENGEIEEDHMI